MEKKGDGVREREKKLSSFKIYRFVFDEKKNSC